MKAPDAIVVLAGGIKQETSGRWVSTDLTAADNELGAPGGKLRVLAAAVLGNQYPTAVVVTSGGKGYDVPADAPEERPLLAEILRDELTALGVASERIILERLSNTTYQQLQTLQTMLAERGLARAVLLTNRWHIPRVQAILNIKFPELANMVEVVSAEEVLIEHNREKWEPEIIEAYASAWLARRREKEDQGIKQIEAGTYTFI